MNEKLYKELEDCLERESIDLIKVCNKYKTLKDAEDLIDALALLAFVNHRLYKLTESELELAEKHIMESSEEGDEDACKMSEDCQYCEISQDCAVSHILGLIDDEKDYTISELVAIVENVCEAMGIQDEKEQLSILLDVSEELDAIR